MAECKVEVTFFSDMGCQALFSGKAHLAGAEDEAREIPMEWHTIAHRSGHAARPNRALGTAYGVDGCRKGWFAFGLASSGEREYGIATTFDVLVSTAKDPGRIFVDIPIGLPPGDSCDNEACENHHRKEGGLGGRCCDVQARRLLKWPRASSVFTPPVREALSVTPYSEASRINRKATDKGLTKQAYAIRTKIKEVDDLLQKNEATCEIREVHPEICFWALAEGEAMKHSKKSPAGFHESLELLRSSLPSACRDFAEIRARFRSWDLADDDILDAMAAAVTAWPDERMLMTLPARRMHDDPPKDCRDRPMEMVYSSEALGLRRE